MLIVFGLAYSNIEARPGFALSYAENPAAVAFTEASILLSRIDHVDWQWQTNRLNLFLPSEAWSMALDVSHEGLDKLPITGLNQDGSFGTTAYFSHQKTAALLSLAGTVISGLWVGTNLKTYSEHVYDQTAKATGFDVGILWQAVSSLYLGWSRTDFGGTRQTWSTQKVEIKPAEDFLSATWTSPEASISYIASPIKPHQVRGQFHFIDGVWISATAPINDLQNVSLQVDLKVSPLTIRYTTDFSEANNHQSQLTWGWSLWE